VLRSTDEASADCRERRRSRSIVIATAVSQHSAIPASAATEILNRAFSITAEVDVPRGVLRAFVEHGANDAASRSTFRMIDFAMCTTIWGWNTTT